MANRPLTNKGIRHILNKVNFMERQGTCMEWTDMMHTQQQMQKIVRALLPVRKSLLTASECELLAHLYL